MKIAFCCQHNYYGGLGNQGGSRTIVLSAMMLNELGHKAYVVTQHKDKLTWFKHPKPLKCIPKDTDVCIACSVSDIKPMLTRMPKRAKAFWWCRLLEDYQMPKSKIIRHASKVHTLVNSECLQRWFAKHGVKTTVAYQGVDVDQWKDWDTRGSKKTIGFLVSKKKRKRFNEIKAIINQLGDKYDYVGYGTDIPDKDFVKTKMRYFKRNADYDDLLGIYNMAHIWLATSTSEGLHNPPMEAALCGCTLVCTDASRNGTKDYAIDGETAYCYPRGNIEMACAAIEKASGEKVVKAAEKIIQKISDRKTAMERLIEYVKK